MLVVKGCYLIHLILRFFNSQFPLFPKKRFQVVLGEFLLSVVGFNDVLSDKPPWLFFVRISWDFPIPRLMTLFWRKYEKSIENQRKY
jgi:hypothetical protein